MTWLEPLRQRVRACFGAFTAGVADGPKLRHDHGSQFVADNYQCELALLHRELARLRAPARKQR